MKIVAIIGLLFSGYCWLNVAMKRQHYSSVQLTLWLIMIGLGGWWCVSTLLK